MKRILTLILILFAAGAFAAEGMVVKVIDGDTLDIFLQGRGLVRVRLIGIDTPESKKNQKAFKDSARNGQNINEIVAMGKEAADFTRKTAPRGSRVKLEYDIQRTDKYGRDLAYLYLESGAMLNEFLCASGYAAAAAYPPNVKYQNRFEAAQRQARENRLGLWQ